MKLQDGNFGSVGGGIVLGRSWRRALQVTAMTLLFGLPFGMGPGHAAPVQTTPAAPSAHVYLLRGVLNIFSLGMDEIAFKLEKQGIKTTVSNYVYWESLANEAAADYKSGKAKTIVLVGHSSGATALPDMVARLDQLGAPVTLAIGLDSVFQTSLKGRVGRYMNLYISNGAGTRVEKTRQLRGTLDNIDVATVPGMGHGSIDKLEVIQQRVISAIDSVVFKRPVAPRPPVTAETPPASSPPKPGTSTANAAVSTTSR